MARVMPRQHEFRLGRFFKGTFGIQIWLVHNFLLFNYHVRVPSWFNTTCIHMNCNSNTSEWTYNFQESYQFSFTLNPSDFVISTSYTYISIYTSDPKAKVNVNNNNHNGQQFKNKKVNSELMTVDNVQDP